MVLHARAGSWRYRLAIVQITLPTTLCPAVGINHLADLARLPFRGTVSDYQEAFLAKMAHVGYLSPEQQVRLFTGGSLKPSVSMSNSKPHRICKEQWH
jgi:hypothetical protein